MRSDKSNQEWYNHGYLDGLIEAQQLMITFGAEKAQKMIIEEIKELKTK